MKTYKRFILPVLALVIILGSIPFFVTYGSNRTTYLSVTVDGRHVEFSSHHPVFTHYNYYVPVRDVFYTMGFEVRWFSDTRSAALIHDGAFILIPSDRPYVTVNGIAFYPIHPQLLINGRMMMTLDAIANMISGEAIWHSHYQVDIHTAFWQPPLPYEPYEYYPPYEPYHPPIYYPQEPWYPPYEPEPTPDPIPEPTPYQPEPTPYQPEPTPYIPEPTPYPTPYPTIEPTPEPMPEPTPEPIPEPTPPPTPQPTPEPTPEPTPTPIPSPTPLPTPIPIARPTPRPPNAPTPAPTPRPPGIPQQRRIVIEEMNAWMNHYHTQGGPNAFEMEIIRLVNDIRYEAGIHPLNISPTLMMAARFRAQGMSDMGYFSHTNPVYGLFRNIPEELFGYPADMTMGENIARWHRTPRAFVESLMNSEGHRANILRECYTEIGTGFFNLRWVQIFGSGDTSHVEAPTSAPW